MVELLSSTRDFASLNAAISNGADSVYLGINGYNLRANVPQFHLDQLKSAVKLCHDSEVKLYVCTNTIMKDEDLKSLKEIMTIIKSFEADAIIASDLGVLNIARENDIEVHMSVQANISNLESLKLLKEWGVNRVILSRELSLDEIKKIKAKSPLEVEVFIHGAMCMAISGRCFLSSHLYNKNANCGECLQPCRENWKLVSADQTNPDSIRQIEINQEEDISYLLSPRDLCMIEHIPELIETGIDAFKIEGRARSADYVATVTRTYREAIDKCYNNEWELNPEWLTGLKKVFNRGFDTGFYYRKPYRISKYNEATHIKKDVGEVTNYYNNVSAAEIRLWDHLKIGDEIIIEGKTTGSFTQLVESMQIHHNKVTEAKRDQNVAILVENKVRPNDIVYKRIDKKK
ncbi:MAG: U32 family peptidase [Methanobacterium sp.]|nr:U32 family peptidase [Methanobacterium sp.]